MRERFVVVTEEGKYFFVHKVELENTHKKISLAANSELSRRNFFTRVKKYLKDDKHHSLYFSRKYARKPFASWNRHCPQTNIRAYFRANLRILLI